MIQRISLGLLTIILLSFIFNVDNLNNAQSILHNHIQEKSLTQRKSQIIPVTIRLEPVHYLHNYAYVATNTNITAVADIEDEKFKNLSLTYQWSTKDTNIITNSTASQIVYHFDKPDNKNFLKVLVLHRPNDTGVSQKNLIIRDPVQLTNVVGKTLIEHGELLRLTFKLNGTGPFSYCHRSCLEVDKEDCEKCKPNVDTFLSEVNITHYLRHVGNYTLLFNVDNIANQQEKRLTVRVSETVKPKHYPYMPIVCSISAVFILLTGIGLHMKFKQTVNTETADFDFTRNLFDEEELAEEQSFVQRVIYLLFKAPAQPQRC